MENVKKFSCNICGSLFATKRQLACHKIGKHNKKPRLCNVTINPALSEWQLGYLAGFLDGEGGIQITKSLRKDREYRLALHPTIYFSNTNRLVMEALKRWLNLRSMIVVRYGKRRYKSIYTLHITGIKNISSLLTKLTPYLIVKRKQAEIMLEYCKNRLSHYRGKSRRYNRKEIRLYRTLIRLNKRG
jgi:hypothetical protein